MSLHRKGNKHVYFLFGEETFIVLYDKEKLVQNLIHNWIILLPQNLIMF